MITHIHFQTMPVTDMTRALDFYRDIMGFKVERDEAYGDSRWIFMRIPGARTLLHFEQRERIEPGETPTLILAADDVDATCAVLRERGATIAHEPADAPWEPGTRWAYVNDSEGNLLLVQTIKEEDRADG